MASSTSKPAKLGQLLQQQQEPFALEVYLIESGYVKKSFNSKTEEKLGRCKSNGNSRKFLSRPTSSGLNKSRKVSKIWRAVCNKLVCTNKSQSLKNSDDKETEFGVHELPRNGELVSESDSYSSASSTTVYNSCSESDKDETPTSFHKQQHDSSLTAETLRALKLYSMKEKMAAADRKFQRRFTDDNKQHSPVSVLEAISSHESSPLYNTQLRPQGSGTPRCLILPSKVTEESILSASLWELLLHSASEKPIIGNGVSELIELVRSNPSPQLLKSRRMLQQTRQLLFDCVRELVESHATKEGQKHRCREFLGPEELGKLLSEKMKGWSRHGGDQRNITHLLHSDVSDSTQEWTGFEPETREIGLEIGDAILDEIMNEIVAEAK
ncbi:uncharacterized protein LOC107420617 isoform X2 [Ziziphus jujuba]|uniref:Uncharacterized protein LOC107420617 isoform X2 n=1 Tax=Ziziphus jujuba TaxID=326968 RepID=A0A6P3ZY42_ZIZJJ|nr:uncharacterized protein LOC107420617 isoform X2 [Ziziphus jujuba]